MNRTEDELKEDVRKVGGIAIVPTLLHIICQTTGMGFAAVARVTEERWITCSVRDDIHFGLVPGSELKIETTICNDIRDSFQAVVIDNVDESDLFREHHTPLMYGFKSYISYPIILRSGEFFGTLCAIDPLPRKVDTPVVIGTFTAFAELISFHLEQLKINEINEKTVLGLNRALVNSRDENRQYRHVSTHTLREPLRKLSMFSGMLIDASRADDREKIQQLSFRIKRSADRFANLINDLTEFSSLSEQEDFKLVNLEQIAKMASTEFRPLPGDKSAEIEIGALPTIPGIPAQIHQLFHHLFDNSIKFAKPDRPLKISVSATEFIPSSHNFQLPPEKEYTEIIVSDNGIGIEEQQLETIFDVFSKLPNEIFLESEGIGLSICRKVVRNHFGEIWINSRIGEGTKVSLILPTA